jgi:hypothetical protein
MQPQQPWWNYALIAMWPVMIAASVLGAVALWRMGTAMRRIAYLMEHPPALASLASVQAAMSAAPLAVFLIFVFLIFLVLGIANRQFSLAYTGQYFALSIVVSTVSFVVYAVLLRRRAQRNQSDASAGRGRVARPTADERERPSTLDPPSLRD